MLNTVSNDEASHCSQCSISNALFFLSHSVWCHTQKRTNLPPTLVQIDIHCSSVTGRSKQEKPVWDSQILEGSDLWTLDKWRLFSKKLKSSNCSSLFTCYKMSIVANTFIFKFSIKMTATVNSLNNIGNFLSIQEGCRVFLMQADSIWLRIYFSGRSLIHMNFWLVLVLCFLKKWSQNTRRKDISDDLSSFPTIALHKS